MSSATRQLPDDPRRVKGRENAKDTLCRNVTIYGHCRYEEKGCAFNHDSMKNQPSLGKKFSVDSPTFTPSTLSVTDPSSKAGLSPKAAGAAVFRPKNLGPALDFSPAVGKRTFNPVAADWALGAASSEAQVQDFLPQNHALQHSLWRAIMAHEGSRLPFSGHPECMPGRQLGMHQTPQGTFPPSEAYRTPPHGHLHQAPRPIFFGQGNDSPARQQGMTDWHGNHFNVGAQNFIPAEREYGVIPDAFPRVAHRTPTRSSGPPSRRAARWPSHHSACSEPSWREDTVFRETTAQRRRYTSLTGESVPSPSLPHRTPPCFSQPLYHGGSHAHEFYQGDTNGGLTQGLYDPYVNNSTNLIGHSPGQQQAQINPYAQDSSSNGTNYFQSTSYQQPVQYHLYASLAPHREAILPHQRAAHEFFIPDSLREELQRKSAATLQTLPNSTLPLQIDHFHSLVPLDTTNQKNSSLFGLPSWVYKAVSSKDGYVYALRRLEGYRLTNEKAIRSIQNWKRINNGNVVTVIDAFTNRGFGDSSLMIAYDYHPLAKTLLETHFTPSRFQPRTPSPHVPESMLWNYIVQIANAIRAVHGAGLAVRLIEPSKILITSKNRIRLNALGVLDIVQFEVPRTLIELQKDDFIQFGRLIVALGTNTPSVKHSLSQALDHFNRVYSPQLKERVNWLLTQPPTKNESINGFLFGLEEQVISSFDSALHLNDRLTTDLNREVENSRIVRLMTKLSFIIERPDYQNNVNPMMSGVDNHSGDRSPIRLFRDYVFHQVDAHGNPVLDLAHVLACLNKLDAGVEEKIVLTSRDDQVVMVVSFKEMKRAVESAFGELMKATRRGQGM